MYYLFDCRRWNGGGGIISFNLAFLDQHSCSLPPSFTHSLSFYLAFISFHSFDIISNEYTFFTVILHCCLLDDAVFFAFFCFFFQILLYKYIWLTLLVIYYNYTLLLVYAICGLIHYVFWVMMWSVCVCVLVQHSK